MRWATSCFRGAVHLFSRLQRQLPLIGEAIRCGGMSIPQALRASSLYTREPWSGSWIKYYVDYLLCSLTIAFF